jgi:hypothetical protein
MLLIKLLARALAGILFFPAVVIYPFLAAGRHAVCQAASFWED